MLPVDQFHYFLLKEILLLYISLPLLYLVSKDWYTSIGSSDKEDYGGNDFLSLTFTQLLHN